MYVRYDLAYAYVVLTSIATHSKGQRALKHAYPPFFWLFWAIAHHLCYWLGSSTSKMKSFSWTSIKTLDMHMIGPHGHDGKFSMSNKCWKAHNLDLLMIMCYSTLSLLVIQISNYKNAKFCHGRQLGPWIWFFWPSRPWWLILNVKQAQMCAPFCRLSCAIAHHIFCWSIFPMSKIPKFPLKIC